MESFLKIPQKKSVTRPSLIVPESDLCQAVSMYSTCLLRSLGDVDRCKLRAYLADMRISGRKF